MSGGHRYGGAWTELKLDVVSDYLHYYTDVLKAAPSPASPFRLWYVDAFAGSGTRTAQVTRGGLLEGCEVEIEDVEFAGSARRALQVVPPFHKFVFIEGNRSRFRDLAELEREFAGRNIQCLHGEANAELRRLFGGPPWSQQKGNKGGDRAVVFLDPYGMSVEWRTLKALADTQSVDVWYLFPTEGINRQLSGKLERVDQHKQLKLDEIFGTPQWRQQLYQVNEVTDLLGSFREVKKSVTKQDIEVYGRQQLGTIFNYVSSPIRLSAEGRGLMFSLFCPALGLIKKGVDWLHKRHAMASHHTSGR
jgi:three-Cys-motif partner protein